MKKQKLIIDILHIWKFVAKPRKKQLIALFILMVLSIFAEMISIGAIFPFLNALTDPEKVMQAEWFQPFMNIFGIKSTQDLLVTMTLVFIIAVLLSSGIKILLIWLNTRVSASMAIDLRTEVYRKSLYKNYESLIKENSSNLIILATHKVSNVTSTAILGVLTLTISFFASIAIILTLLLIDPFVATIAFTILGGGYIIIGMISRKILKRNSDISKAHNPLALKQFQEGIGGIRDVILDNSQKVFLNNYTLHVRKYQLANSSNTFISQIPKYIIEVFGIVLIAMLALYLESQEKAALPILGALALGSQRLMPAMQQIYAAWSNIMGSHSIISEVSDYLEMEIAKNELITPSKIKFEKMINIENISFKYQETNKNVLDNLSLSISKGMRVGFIGETGSGKSTLLDMIMGLLIPSNGNFKIDDEIINEGNRQSWQKYIAHVPQAIYLSDASIAENIAFGLSKDEINLEKVKDAAEKANLAGFINDLEFGFNTSVGERGVQLSGGQRQRIGIARALYKEAEVIILDEATSALDNETEKSVMDAINKLDKNLTILMIAHRLTTLKGCDMIVKLNNGKIESMGDYSTMIEQKV